jgi:nicotinamidase-related amidase
MTNTNDPITPQNSAIALIDHQPGVMAMIDSLPQEVIAKNVGILARLGEQSEIPLVITTTRETLDFLGSSIEPIQEGAPEAYRTRVARGGFLDAFEDPAFEKAIESTGRRKLILAGILTDVCLWHSAISAQAAGYEVSVVADANGTTTSLADEVTYARLRERGIDVTSTFGTVFQLYPDLSTTEGKAAEAIVSGQA